MYYFQLSLCMCEIYYVKLSLYISGTLILSDIHIINPTISSNKQLNMNFVHTNNKCNNIRVGSHLEKIVLIIKN